MHDLEKLKQSQEKAYAEAVESNRIHAALPVMPKSVGFSLGNVPWVTYEVATLEEAIDLFRQYTPLPWVIAENGSFTRVDLWSEIERKDTSKGGSPYTVRHAIEDGAPYFECQHGVGFATNEMEFFANAAGRTLKICVRIKDSPIRVHLVPISPNTGHRGQKSYRKDYPNHEHAKVLKWGYGDDCCKGTYWYPDLASFWLSMGNYVSTEGLPE